MSSLAIDLAVDAKSSSSTSVLGPDYHPGSFAHFGPKIKCDGQTERTDTALHISIYCTMHVRYTDGKN